MFLRSRMLLRSLTCSSVQTCLHLQTASITVSEKPCTESVQNLKHQSMFPVHEVILNQIRHDVFLTDAYKHRVVDKTRPHKEMLNDKLNTLNQSDPPTKQQLKALTQQELNDFILELADMTLSQKKVDTDLMRIVEDECCFRAKNMASAELLFVADAFFVMRYQHHCSRFYSAMFREFEHRWTDMTIQKEDVVQLAMCIVMWRKFPLHLVRNIEQFVCSNIDKFSAGELSLICSAFFMTNTSFGNVEVMDKLASAVLLGVACGELKAYQLGSMLKALRHAHFAKLSFCDNLGNLLNNSPDLWNEFMLIDLSNIAFAYASLRISHPTLFARILSHAVKLIENQTFMRIKDVGRIVWSFGLLQEPQDKVVQDQLLFILRRDVYLMEQFTEAFTEALLGLAMQKIYPVDLLQRLFMTKFLRQKYDFRLQMLDSAARVESPEYASLQLQPDVICPNDAYKLKFDMSKRQGLLSLVTSLYQILGDPACVWCHCVLPYNKITDVELRLDSCGHPVKFNEELSDVHVIKNMNLMDCRFTPSYTEKSITNQLLTQSSSPSVARVNSGGFIHIMPEKMPNSSQRRIILKVMGWNQYIVNRPVLIGIHQMELRLLAKMGYEVLVVSAGQAQQLDAMSASQRYYFVQDILVNRLNIDVSKMTTA